LKRWIVRVRLARARFSRTHAWFLASAAPHNISFGSRARGGVEALAFSTAYDRRADLRRYFKALLRDWEMIHFIAQEFGAQAMRW
jgi:hypothetical protein